MLHYEAGDWSHGLRVGFSIEFILNISARCRSFYHERFSLYASWYLSLHSVFTDMDVSSIPSNPSSVAPAPLLLPCGSFLWLLPCCTHPIAPSVHPPNTIQVAVQNCRNADLWLMRGKWRFS